MEEDIEDDGECDNERETHILIKNKEENIISL